MDLMKFTCMGVLLKRVEKIVIGLDCIQIIPSLRQHIFCAECQLTYSPSPACGYFFNLNVSSVT